MDTTTNNSNRYKLNYGIILIALFIFSLVACFLGFQSYFVLHGEEQNWIRSLYRTLQLFTFEGGDLLEPIPLALHIARFTAPLTTVMALIIALYEIFNEQWNLIKISRMKNHVVIIGFGTKGKNVLEECRRKGEKVLVIEKDALNTNLPSIRSGDARLLISDASNRSTIIKARISKAKTVFLLMGDDTEQVTACLHIYQLIKESSRNETNPLICIMHLQNQDFMNVMRSYNLVTDIHDGFSLRIFNIYENSARELFEDNPPDHQGITSENVNYIQIIIFGFGHAGEALALQTALTGHYLNNKKSRVVIIDRLADAKVIKFIKRYPTYEEYCDLVPETLEANSPQLIQHLTKYLEDPRALNTLVLCFGNDTNNLMLGLQLGKIKLNEIQIPPQIFIRTNDNESFTAFSENIKPYGLSSKVCSWEVIFEGNLDRKAKAMHENHLKTRKTEPDFGTREADVSWENLSQEYKDSNRKAADHIGVKMRGIGCEIANEKDPRPGATFSDVEIEQLSKLEHSRWNAERSLAGWVYNEIRNDKARKTPYLTDWDQLSEDVKEYDRIAVKNIPDVLRLVGMKVVRQIKQVN